jgi:predicted acyl esterase
MVRKKYSILFILVLVVCLLIFLLNTSILQTQTTCEDELKALKDKLAQFEKAPIDVRNYIRGLYKGPYKKMWWVERLENPAIDWEVASVKFFDQLPGSALPKGIIFERNVPVEMRDGLKLAANVFRPEKPGKFPVIMNFTPFCKDAYLQHDDFGASELTAFEAADPGWWVPNDYVVVLCDWRGTGRSPGKAAPFISNYDLYDGIQWAARQEWSDGNVGMFGHSALAMSQWNAAGMENPPPALKAIIPWGGMTDRARDTKFPGGIPETKFMASRGPNKPFWQKDFVPQEMPPAPPSRLENIKIPTLIGACWGDKKQHLRGNLRAWRTISTPLKYKWLYTYSERKWQGMYTPLETRKTQLMFFDQFLKGIDSGIMNIPRVRLAVQVKLLDWLVRYEDDWPIPRTQYTKLFLGNNSTLNLNKPEKMGKVIYDSADGKVIFDIKFDRDTEISGHIMLKLWVSPNDSDDMDLFITLRKLNAAGHEVNFDSDIMPGRLPVDYGWLRLSKRELDKDLSKPWLPEQKSVTPGEPQQKVKPGDIVSCEIQLVGSSTIFYAGETLRLEISGKMEEDNLFAYTDLVNRGRHTIYFGGEYDSYLLVPIIPPKG